MTDIQTIANLLMGRSGPPSGSPAAIVNDRMPTMATIFSPSSTNVEDKTSAIPLPYSNDQMSAANILWRILQGKRGAQAEEVAKHYGKLSIDAGLSDIR